MLPPARAVRRRGPYTLVTTKPSCHNWGFLIGTIFKGDLVFGETGCGFSLGGFVLCLFCHSDSVNLCSVVARFATLTAALKQTTDSMKKRRITI
ncbi:hypothetical protein SAMN03159407_4252 [Rhizobium sp. NFR12]|nr:hypothetical protein SAMN03159407_4252 [Rhizobium sp. NFR12]